MANDHIFISYSRADGDFAQKIAGDLRERGVNIWLDKMDIPIGARWDRAVEEALETCGRLLLIMSPTSVGSENVMDEISEAFQNNKQIIPIMHQKCDVPMRIRRLQYIDFTGDYETALSRLLEVVGQEPAASKPAPPRPAPVSPVPTPSASRRNLFIGIGAVLILLLALVVIFSGGDESPEDTSSGQTNALAAETGLDVEAVLDCQEEENLKAPSDTSIPATIKFSNRRSEGITIYHVDTTGQWFQEAKLGPSEEKTFDTHAGQIWQAADTSDNCLGIYKVGPEQNHVEVK